MTEKDFIKLIKKHHEGHHTSIENSADAGIPDYYIRCAGKLGEGFVEYKTVHNGFVFFRSKQLLWARDFVNAGGEFSCVIQEGKNESLTALIVPGFVLKEVLEQKKYTPLTQGRCKVESSVFSCNEYVDGVARRNLQDDSDFVHKVLFYALQ